MSEPKKFNFAKPGATPPKPVAPAAPATVEAEVVPTESPTDAPEQAAPQNLPAVPPPAAPPAFYTGEEDTPYDPQDQRLPRLNIVQKSSQAEWLPHGIGALLLKGQVKLPQPARMVVAGARPKVWIEKTKFGSSVKARVARSLDEVAKLGGTDVWRFSKENPDSNSAKPWFMPSVTLLVLIEKPDSLPEDHFGYVAGDKLYAAALVSVKSTNYDAFWVTISSERQGLLKKGFSSRFLNVSTVVKQFKGGESGVFKVAFGEETPEEVRKLAHKLAVGE